jgi:hypothetical protein
MEIVKALLSAVVVMTLAGAGQQPLPAPVEVRPEPEGVTLEDPAFEPLPGARADFGRLGGSVYQIEVPDDWNGRLVLEMHGYGELAPRRGSRRRTSAGTSSVTESPGARRASAARRSSPGGRLMRQPRSGTTSRARMAGRLAPT